MQRPTSLRSEGGMVAAHDPYTGAFRSIYLNALD